MKLDQRNRNDPETRARSFSRRTGRDAFVVYAVEVGGHRFPMGWRSVRAEAETLRTAVAANIREGSNFVNVIVEAV